MADFLGSIEAQRALKMSLIAEVAQAYFELVALDNELAIVKQTLNAREEGVRLAKIRFEAVSLPKRPTSRHRWNMPYCHIGPRPGTAKSPSRKTTLLFWQANIPNR